MEKRKLVMIWWNDLPQSEKGLYMEGEFKHRHPQSLTGSEIEKLYDRVMKDATITQIREVIKNHTEKLNTMKENRSKWEEEKWSDADLKECDGMITTLASILSDLNRILA